MINSSPYNQKKLLAAFLMILFVFISGLLLFPRYLHTKYNWKIFASDRPAFSFQYPPDWPVSRCSDDMVFQFENRVDQIDFSKECSPSAGSDSLGYIIVNRITPITNQIDYLYGKYKNETEQDNIKLINIGNKLGYLVSFKPLKPPKQATQAGTFYFVNEKYFVFRNNLLYEIALTNPDYIGNREKNIQTFQKILSTFNFKD